MLEGRKSGRRNQAGIQASIIIPIAQIVILLNLLELGLANINESRIDDSVKSNTDRINFILNEELGVLVLIPLEGFLQRRLRPELEGFDSQR